MIRILLVDDQQLVLEGMRVLLGTRPDLRVVGTAQNGAEALDQAASLQPDLVLMDLKMPVMNGIQATRALRERLPEVRVLVLTTYDDDEWLADAVRAGAHGYLLKDARKEELFAAIDDVMGGRTPVDPAVAGRLFGMLRHGAPPDPAAARDLTARELDVLRLVAHGLTNAEIGAQLFLAEGTVRNHVSALLEKLGVNDRTQAAAYAWRHGLAPRDQPGAGTGSD